MRRHLGWSSRGEVAAKIDGTRVRAFGVGGDESRWLETAGRVEQAFHVQPAAKGYDNGRHVAAIELAARCRRELAQVGDEGRLLGG